MIIGGGIAGVTATETIRARDHEGSIALISGESLPLYSRVMLPSYVRGRLNRERVFLRSVADYEAKGVALFLGNEVVGINLERREVHTNIGKIFSYKTLLISTGGVPARWHVEGGDHPLAYRLQTMEDADRLREILQKSSEQNARLPGRQALVIGCGFIGLEFIESYIAYGMRPFIIMPEDYAFARFVGPEGGRLLEEQWQQRGAEIMRRTTIEALRFSEGGIVALTTEGQGYRGVFAGVGIGLERNISVFTGIGLEVKKSIMVNEFLETNQKGVFAAGDAAEYFDVIFQKHRLTGNWTNAYLQGSIAGENMTRYAHGEQHDYRAFRNVSSYSITHMGMHLAFLGECEKNTRFADESRRAARVEERFIPERRAYQQLFFEGSRLMGASLINHPKDIPAFLARIEQGQKI
ncbi:MAG: FAD-dependent oxidoreductase [Candidatus Sungbacteria bacterium]|nr:FAD-dependent oxidoreductase [Candidatus Sungbacteria bacterium]